MKRLRGGVGTFWEIPYWRGWKGVTQKALEWWGIPRQFPYPQGSQLGPRPRTGSGRRLWQGLSRHSKQGSVLPASSGLLVQCLDLLLEFSNHNFQKSENSPCVFLLNRTCIRLLIGWPFSPHLHWSMRLVCEVHLSQPVMFSFLQLPIPVHQKQIQGGAYHCWRSLRTDR